MTGHLFHIFAFVAITSILPYPRWRLYDSGATIAVRRAIVFVVAVWSYVKPLFVVAKVDMQSKVRSGVIFLSTLAPRMGEYILSRGFGLYKLRETFDESVGEDMVGFRRDLRKKYVDRREVSETTPSKAELLSDIKRTRTQIRQRHTIGEVLIGVTGSALALLVGMSSMLAGFAVLISVYLVIFPISMFLRTIVVDTLAYSGELVDESQDKVTRVSSKRIATLGFQQGWNKLLLRKERVIHKLILVSFIRGELVLGYELGDELIDKVLNDDMEIEGAFEELVDETLGDSVEGHLFRRLVKQFLGV